MQSVPRWEVLLQEIKEAFFYVSADKVIVGGGGVEQSDVTLSGTPSLICLLLLTIVNCNNDAKNYFGLCETEFKARYYNHVQSFRHRRKSNATELSKYVWSCRDAGYELTIAWSIVCHAKPYQQGDQQCQLCLAEKYSILTANPSTTLNKRTELVNKGRHKNKYKLKNCKLET